jgi:hypothetical protein
MWQHVNNYDTNFSTLHIVNHDMNFFILHIVDYDGILHINVVIHNMNFSNITYTCGKFLLHKVDYDMNFSAIHRMIILQNRWVNFVSSLK